METRVGHRLFAKWCRASKRSDESVAEELGTHRTTIWRLRKGKFIPGVDLMTDVARLTGALETPPRPGSVPMSAWSASVRNTKTARRNAGSAQSNHA